MFPYHLSPKTQLHWLQCLFLRSILKKLVNEKSSLVVSILVSLLVSEGDSLDYDYFLKFRLHQRF